jgi:tRNA(Arg) A34 adenosine deaminase TadA
MLSLLPQRVSRYLYKTEVVELISETDRTHSLLVGVLSEAQASAQLSDLLCQHLSQAALYLFQPDTVRHAEVVAIMLAEQRLQAFNLRLGGQRYELFSSCDPCAMCLGAVHWSGVERLVCGASRDDAQRIGFDEGPVFQASYTYLEERGMEIVQDVCCAQANSAIQAYSGAPSKDTDDFIAKIRMSGSGTSVTLSILRDGAAIGQLQQTL